MKTRAINQIRGYEYYAGLQKAQLELAKQTPGASAVNVATQLFDKVFSQMPVGTPDQALSTIQDIRELVHPSHIAAAMKFGGMPMEFAEKSLRLFAKEVLPAIQEMPVLEPIVREPARRVDRSRPTAANPATSPALSLKGILRRDRDG
jgi:hypothetical protein